MFRKYTEKYTFAATRIRLFFQCVCPLPEMIKQFLFFRIKGNGLRLNSLSPTFFGKRKYAKNPWPQQRGPSPASTALERAVTNQEFLSYGFAAPRRKIMALLESLKGDLGAVLKKQYLFRMPVPALYFKLFMLKGIV